MANISVLFVCIFYKIKHTEFISTLGGVICIVELLVDSLDGVVDVVSVNKTIFLYYRYYIISLPVSGTIYVTRQTLVISLK